MSTPSESRSARSSPSARTPPANVDEYLAGLPEPERRELERVREIVRAAAPEATERIGYHIPVLALHGDLVGFAAQRKHLSFYVMSPELVASMAEEIAPFRIGGSSTIHFTPDEPLPTELITSIVQARVRENEERESARGGS